MEEGGGRRGRRRRLPRTPFLNVRFSAAIKEFGTALKNSSLIVHRGNKGGEREEALRQFFRERMPANYSIVEGEVVDLNGQASPQLDVMFYDQSINFALVSGLTNVLPAEALLASIEVKSILTKGEIEKSVNAARKLRALRPYDRDLGGVDVGDSGGRVKLARYYHCLFAYDTDLAEQGWLSKEGARLFSGCGTDHVIDAVYVLNRGLINLTRKGGMLENESGGAIMNFYFSILNFIQRESPRRRETPFGRYVTHATQTWTTLS
jgi:hypothetical protein